MRHPRLTWFGFLFLFVIVGQFGFVQDVEDQAHSHSHDGRKTHTGELDISDLDECAGQTRDKYVH